jgi:hypothetical protein
VEDQKRKMIAVEYSQAFNDVAHLIAKHQACLVKIKPFHEKDILFLLLSRYAKLAGTGVYLEMRRSSDVQVYASEIPEPHVSLGSQGQSKANVVKAYCGCSGLFISCIWHA